MDSAVEGSSSSGRRQRDEQEADDEDPLSSIMTKLGLGNGGATQGSTVVMGAAIDAAVHVMMEVLQIDFGQAKFFLESAANDVAVAVDLHFELAGNAKRAKAIGGVTFSESSAAFGSGSGGSSGGFGMNRSPQAARFLRREVVIAGLTAGWTAFVNEFSGRLEFTNCYTGETQAQVPPGFADLLASETGADGSSTHEDNSDMGGNDEADDADLPALVAPWSNAGSPFHSANDRPLSEGASFDFTPRTALGFGAGAAAAAQSSLAAASSLEQPPHPAPAGAFAAAHPFTAPPSFPATMPPVLGSEAQSSTSAASLSGGDFAFGSGSGEAGGSDAASAGSALGAAPLDPQALPQGPEEPVDDSLDDSL